MKIKDWFLIMLYLIACLALFPILQFEYFRLTPTLDQASPFWVSFRVFFSGPLLLIVGIILLFMLNSNKHKFSGIIFLLVALYWIIGIIKEIVAEIRIF